MKKALTTTLIAAALYIGCANKAPAPITEPQAPQVSIPQSCPLEERVTPSSALNKYPETFTANRFPAAYATIGGDNADLYINGKEDVISAVDIINALNAKESVVDYVIPLPGLPAIKRDDISSRSVYNSDLSWIPELPTELPKYNQDKDK